MARTALDEIQERVRGRVVLNAPMDRLTTLRVGGPADLLVYPEDQEDLATLVSFLTQRGLPYFVLGNGSNLVVRDGGIRGAVICLTEGFRGLEAREGASFRVEAGVAVRRMVRWTVDRGITGFEPLVGIPGSVGGALAMNAGAWDTEIADRVVELEVLTPGGGVEVLGRSELRFRYRGLDLPPGCVIVAAVLEGEPAEPEAVKERARELYARRKESQPLQEPSAGSVFKNPAGAKAARLIEACALKGVRVGDAEVSRIHANFIVNAGMATASQVVALIGMIQERVYVKHRIKLEPEVRIVGEWAKGKLRVQE
ncbi:UDP-N-acetylmuramate dehydrogenase [Deferrisoma camini]|uniref:UDP-N-acetylmuramate dehydrogenase n=1 Tax=Deferrisoma camini TaxID=1035120 RepID=UPI00046D4077|nr:UDP-N-acetylmuramate dehydrogenase [Deferrisoma camini]